MCVCVCVEEERDDVCKLQQICSRPAFCRCDWCYFFSLQDGSDTDDDKGDAPVEIRPKKKKKKERKKEEEFRKTERRSIVGVLHLSVRLLSRQSLCLSHSQ